MTLGYLYDGAYIRHVTSPFTPHQIEVYLKKLKFDVPLGKIEPNLDTLRTLMYRHIVTFPFDDTDLH